MMIRLHARMAGVYLQRTCLPKPRGFIDDRIRGLCKYFPHDTLYIHINYINVRNGMPFLPHGGLHRPVFVRTCIRQGACSIPLKKEWIHSVSSFIRNCCVTIVHIILFRMIFSCMQQQCFFQVCRSLVHVS